MSHTKIGWTAGPALLILLLVLLGGLSTLTPASPPPTIPYAAYDPGLAIIISQITTPTLEYELNGLTGERPVVVAGAPYTIKTRRTGNVEASMIATQYAYEQFAGYGLDVAYHNYALTGDASFRDHALVHRQEPVAARNVVAEKPGRVDPSRIYLLTAHLDDQPVGLRAPGADDNASGSVAVLTAARLLAPHDFAYTIRFVLFTGEEQGLQGSAAYAADCAAKREDIRGVINLDMIAYNADPPPIVDLYAYDEVPASQTLTRAFAYMIGVYGLRLVPDRTGGPGGASDQGSFIAHGYPAILVIEDMDDFNPHWHKVSDRVLALDLDYYADVTRAVVTTIAHLAVLIR